MLSIDGMHVVQSQAIVRYVARRADRLGKTPQEATLADMASHCSPYFAFVCHFALVSCRLGGSSRLGAGHLER